MRNSVWNAKVRYGDDIYFFIIPDIFLFNATFARTALRSESHLSYCESIVLVFETIVREYRNTVAGEWYHSLYTWI